MGRGADMISRLLIVAGAVFILIGLFGNGGGSSDLIILGVGVLFVLGGWRELAKASE